MPACRSLCLLPSSPACLSSSLHASLLHSSTYLCLALYLPACLALYRPTCLPSMLACLALYLPACLYIVLSLLAC